MSPSRAPTKAPKTVDRQIHFYRADTGMEEGQPRALELAGPLRAVEALPWSPDTKRYWTTPDGNAIAAWIDDATGPPQRFRFARIRREALPQSEDAGQLAPLGLGTTAGLYEPTHIAVYGDVFAVEFNFYAPRPSRLPDYLQRALGDAAPDFRLEPIIRQDVAEELRTWRGIRVLELLVRPSYIAQVEEADQSLGAAFRAQAQIGQAGVLGVILRPEPYVRRFLEGGVLGLVQRLSARTDLRENVLKFKVKGQDEMGRINEVDVLDDNLITKRKVVRQNRSRNVEAASAYAEIDRAYDQLRHELERASSVNLR